MKYFLLFFFISLMSFSQRTNNVFLFRVENDKFFNIDKYYTSGLFIEYQRMLNVDFLFLSVKRNQLLLEFVLGNETYTPRVLTSTLTSNFDRPYAGWQFIGVNLKQIKNNQAHYYGFEVGFSGAISGAGKLQSLWHRALNVDVPTWTQEIENKFLVNIKTQHTFNISLNQNNLIHFEISPVLGLKDVYIENGIKYYIGKLNNFKSSSRVNLAAINASNEFYGSVGASFKYVAHNALIQGSLDYKDEFFTSRIVNSVFRLQSGVVYKYKNKLWSFNVYYITKETPISTDHTYGSLSYGFSF